MTNGIKGATSERTNTLPTDRYGDNVLDRMRDHAENGVMKPQFREDLHALISLAAGARSQVSA